MKFESETKIPPLIRSNANPPVHVVSRTGDMNLRKRFSQLFSQRQGTTFLGTRVHQSKVAEVVERRYLIVDDGT